MSLISYLFEAINANANIDLTPIQEWHGKSGKFFCSSNSYAQSLAFVILSPPLTFLLNTHLTEYIIDPISSFSDITFCFFQFCSSTDLAVVWFSIWVIYILTIVLWLFLNICYKGCGAFSKDGISLSNSICLILLLPSFTFHFLYFPVAVPDLEIIFANFKLLLSFSRKPTITFFNICFSVFMGIAKCSFDTLSCLRDSLRLFIFFWRLRFVGLFWLLSWRLTLAG